MPPFYKRILGHAYAIYIAPRAIVELARGEQNTNQALQYAADCFHGLYKRLDGIDANKAPTWKVDGLNAKVEAALKTFRSHEARIKTAEKERKTDRANLARNEHELTDVRRRLCAIEQQRHTFTCDAKGFDVLSARIDQMEMNK